MVSIVTTPQRLLLCACILLPLATGANAQSFNIDLDVFAGPPEADNGAPSSAFGAAAGQPGFWNRIDAAGPRLPTQLADLDGTLTSATNQVPGGSGGAGGSGQGNNSGDFALLLNDYAVVGSEILYHFASLEPGTYRIWTYAVNATGRQVNAEVWVPNSTTANPQFVTGPMPGNAFELGVTHSVHELVVSNDTFDVVVRGPWPYTMVNGFQITMVPEPGIAIALVTGLAGFWARRRRM